MPLKLPNIALQFGENIGTHSKTFSLLDLTSCSKKEFLDKISDEEDNSVEIINDLNLSVTDEDLQKLDDANSRNAFYRKVYPGK